MDVAERWFHRPGCELDRNRRGRAAFSPVRRAARSFPPTTAKFGATSAVGSIPAGGNVWAMAIDTAGKRARRTAAAEFFASNLRHQRLPQTRRYWKDNPALWPVTSLMPGAAASPTAWRNCRKSSMAMGEWGRQPGSGPPSYRGQAQPRGPAQIPGRSPAHHYWGRRAPQRVSRQVAICSRAIVAAGPGDGRRCGRADRLQ